MIVRPRVHEADIWWRNQLVDGWPRKRMREIFEFILANKSALIMFIYWKEMVNKRRIKTRLIPLLSSSAPLLLSGSAPLLLSSGVTT